MNSSLAIADTGFSTTVRLLIRERIEHTWFISYFIKLLSKLILY